MPLLHLYLFSDACPSDWLVDGEDERWHTIANFIFQSDPEKSWPGIEASHVDVLEADLLYGQFVSKLSSGLRSRTLRKWKTSATYRAHFARSLEGIGGSRAFTVSACSFQEGVLRMSRSALLASYNRHIGGVEGGGIGFEEWMDSRGRRHMRHSFVNFSGYHEISGRENQMLVLLLMAWFVADQYLFHSRRLAGHPELGFDGMAMTVVSDTLSEDNDLARPMEMNLRHLVDPDDENVPITLTRSPQSDSFSGDLIVDNLAGLLNAALMEPSGVFADAIRRTASTGIWAGWHILRESGDRLESSPGLGHLA